MLFRECLDGRHMGLGARLTFCSCFEAGRDPECPSHGYSAGGGDDFQLLPPNDVDSGWTWGQLEEYANQLYARALAAEARSEALKQALWRIDHETERWVAACCASMAGLQECDLYGCSSILALGDLARAALSSACPLTPVPEQERNNERGC